MDILPSSHEYEPVSQIAWAVIERAGRDLRIPKYHDAAVRFLKGDMLEPWLEIVQVDRQEVLDAILN